MKYCKNCGKELKEGAQFCKECGTSVQEQNNTTISQNNHVPERKPMSPKQKKWIIAGIAVAVLLISAYKIGDIFYSKERLINNFEEALIAHDEKEVAKLLHSTDKKLEINKDTVKAFVNYYKENPDEIKTTVETLRRQSTVTNAEREAENYEDFLGTATDEMVNLAQNGKVLFYDKYELIIDSVYLNVATNYKDTELYIDKEKVGKSDTADFEKIYGPYIPGIHDVEAKLKTDFVDLVVEDKITVQDGETQTVDLYLEGENVHIDTSIDPEEIDLKGKMYVNGKDVEINPFQEQEFGPVLTDGTMKVVVETELPWGIIKTKEKVIESNYIKVNLGEHEETQKTIMDTVVKSNRESLSAFTTGKTSDMTVATDNLKESVQEEIDRLKDYDELFKGKYISTSFDLDSFNVFYEDKAWIANVAVLIKSQSDYYYEGDTPELEDNDDSYEVKLIYDEKAKKWLVDSLNYTYFNDENVKEVKEESPKEHTTKETASTTEQTNEADESTEINQLMDNYLNGIITAINDDNFDAVSDYLQKDSELYKSQKNLVSNLYSKGTTEELIDYKVTGASEEDQKFTVSTYEKIKINYSNGKSETKEFDWTYKGVKEGTEYLLTSIESK